MPQPQQDNCKIRESGCGFILSLCAFASGDSETEPSHDAAGNTTYDGLHKYEYDAWNRLTTVKTAYLDSNAALQPGATVATIKYDGNDRRIVKDIENSGDWELSIVSPDI